MSLISMLFSYLKKQAEESELECRRVELSLLEENPDAELLDLGCADGEFTLRAAKKIGTEKIHGVEIVEEDIDKAKASGITVHQDDLNEKLPFEDETFDVIIASHIIEHLSDTDIFIKEVHRTLKVGGYLLIATPNLAVFIHILFLLLGKQPYVAMVSDEILAGSWMPLRRCGLSGNHEPAHRRIFTLGALEELLKYHGFRVERVIGSGFFPLPTPLAKIMCFIDKRHATNITIKARKVSERNRDYPKKADI